MKQLSQANHFKKIGVGFRFGLESFDLILRVHGRDIPVHQLILVRASKYFEFLFSGRFEESGKKVIEMDEFEFEIVELVVDFIYSRTVNLSSDNVVDVYELADFLQVTKLLLFCIRFMVESVNPTNCIAYWKLADFYSMPPLREILQTYICKHSGKVVKTTDFLELEFEDVKSIMTNVEMSRLEWVKSYKSIFSAMKAWMNHDTTRSVHSESLVTPTRNKGQLKPDSNAEIVCSGLAKLECSE
ncbi:unnamed protein product [Hermetia illucens]|uniref:BTB domain-containing protein n=1 Tax=Hermetia illucens TaxID=343691 RepID=A0A7R8V6Z5_HERIL|nr:kelch-like protein 7 [Hermetia illucens]CAD7093584.1 unnamed protein product [Hermetia illucens]